MKNTRRVRRLTPNSKAKPSSADSVLRWTLNINTLSECSLIGRTRFGESAEQLDQVPAQNLSDLLKTRGTGELFGELLNRYAQYSGVAGIQRKVLVRDDGGLRTENFSLVETGERLTAHGTTHIVKSFDPARFPGLAANEYLCLRAATAAGLTVAKTSLATDGCLLVVARFDLKTDGGYLAFEDGCALAGRLSREKYEGSYEQLADTLANVLRGPDGTAAELAKFFRSFVLSVAVRNGDAHRKNFGVTYDDATRLVTFAPTFDVITTTAYLPNDSLAMTLDGTKRWPDAKRLVKFGLRHCGLTPPAPNPSWPKSPQRWLASAQTSPSFQTSTPTRKRLRPA